MNQSSAQWLVEFLLFGCYVSTCDDWGHNCASMERSWAPGCLAIVAIDDDEWSINNSSVKWIKAKKKTWKEQCAWKLHNSRHIAVSMYGQGINNNQQQQNQRNAVQKIRWFSKQEKWQMIKRIESEMDNTCGGKQGEKKNENKIINDSRWCSNLSLASIVANRWQEPLPLECYLRLGPWAHPGRANDNDSSDGGLQHLSERCNRSSPIKHSN